MKLTKYTLATTFGALLMDGQAFSPVSATAKGFDLTSVTHGSIQ